MPAPIGEYTQEHILGDEEPPESEVVIESHGKQMRPITALLSHLVDEFKLHVSEDGLYTHHVDPANVALAAINVYPRAFESYELDGDAFVAGVFCGSLHKAVSDARKPHKDGVSLRLDTDRTLVTIARKYTKGTVEWTDRLLNVDADSVRSEPDRTTVDDLIEWEATVEVDALHDAVTHVEKSSDHLYVKEDDGRLIMHAARKRKKSGPINPDDDDDDDRVEMVSESAVDFGEVAEPAEDGGMEGASSLFSIDYIADQVRGLKNAELHEAALGWGHDKPLQLTFEQTDEDGNVLLEGSQLLAPRIKDGGDLDT